MKVFEVQTSSVDKAFALVYDILLKEYGEHKVFEVKLDKVKMTTNCLTVFTYYIEVTDKGSA